MKNLQVNLINTVQGEDGFRLFRPNLPRLAPSCEAKIMPHPRPTTFAGWGKPMQGEAGRGGTKLPSLHYLKHIGGLLVIFN